MKNQQGTSAALLARIGSLLLSALMLTGGLSILSGCSKGDKAETTAEPEIEHLVQTDASTYTLISPDGSLSLNITNTDELSYSVTRTAEDGTVTEWIRPSKMGLQVGGTNYFHSLATVTDVSLNEIERTFDFLGNQSTIEDHCYEAVFSLEQSGFTYYLDTRVYDNGVAFRYRLPDKGTKRTITEELTTYELRTDVTECWYGVNNQDYESVISEYSPTKESADKITAPLTAVVKKDRGFITIMEAAQTESYPGVNLVANGNHSYGTAYYQRNESQTGEIVTGWRLINIADTLNDLVNNYNIYCVNASPDETLYADTSWILPGKSAWSWNVDKQGPTYDQMREYTTLAAELGFEYNIIDEGWRSWASYKNKLKNIGKLGDQYGVNQILWAQVTIDTNRADNIDTTEKVDAMLEMMEECHLDGIKADFWWSEAKVQSTTLQKYVLTKCAEQQFIVNFHGCNKNTGLNVTFPNELNREAVKGHENIGFSDSTNYQTYADWLNAQLYTRFLCGHADWTPAVQSAMQIGSMICIDSPFMAISYDPNLILKSPAVEFIKSVPTVWDKTVVLPASNIGECSVYAKQKDGVWFVGGIYSKNNNSVKVALSEFITDKGTYAAEIWTGEGSSLESKTITVTKDDVIDLGQIKAAQGFAIRLTKLSLSQYGGKINGDITVTAPEGATVKYTTDGSDPSSSSTAVACNGSITLTESCRVKIAITDGDGKGTMLSYQFNKMN